MRTIHSLRERLEAAIRDEAYEDAAKLRDELAAMETESRG
jgi:protein-arginine kinase activator protein McsA